MASLKNANKWKTHPKKQNPGRGSCPVATDAEKQLLTTKMHSLFAENGFVLIDDQKMKVSEDLLKALDSGLYRNSNCNRGHLRMFLISELLVWCSIIRLLEWCAMGMGDVRPSLEVRNDHT